MPNDIRMIYHWVADERRSTVWVAAELNRRDIPTRFVLEGRKMKQNGQARPTMGVWRPGRVRNIICNSAYRGVAVYGRQKAGKSPYPVPITERKVPAIVDEATWSQAQEAMHHNCKTAKRNRKRDYLLAGLVKCGACGSNYTDLAYKTAKGEERRYYTCNRVHQHHNTGGERCKNPALSY